MDGRLIYMRRMPEENMNTISIEAVSKLIGLEEELIKPLFVS